MEKTKHKKDNRRVDRVINLDVNGIELHNTRKQEKKAIKMENDTTHLSIGYLWNSIAKNMKYYILHQEDALDLIESHRKKLKVGCDTASAECVDAEIDNLLTKFYHRVKYNIDTLDTYFVDKIDRVTQQESELQMEVEIMQRQLNKATERLKELSLQKIFCERGLEREVDELKKIAVVTERHITKEPVIAKKRKSEEVNKAIKDCEIEMTSVMNREEDL